MGLGLILGGFQEQKALKADLEELRSKRSELEGPVSHGVRLFKWRRIAAGREPRR